MFGQGGEVGELGHAQGAIEDGHAADPAVKPTLRELCITRPRVASRPSPRGQGRQLPASRGEGVSCDSGNVGSEAVPNGGLTLHEVPEGDAAGGAGDGGDARGVGAGWHGGGGTSERENDAGDA